MEDSVNVILELGGARNDGWSMAEEILDETLDLLVVGIDGRFFLKDNIDFILYDEDIFEFHDLDGSEMLLGLGLGTGHISCNQEDGAVHDSGSRKHCAHENVVPWAIDEGDVSDKLHDTFTVFVITFYNISHVACVGFVALGFGTFWAPVDFGVSISESDGNISDLF